MGNCRSSETRATAVTAKLILDDGQLQEFSSPIKVSLLLQQNPDCFICSSDEMRFDQFAAAMDGDEVLQPGEVYFVLPQWRRRQRLRAEDMAALAVKASLALSTSGSSDEIMSGGCGCCCVSSKVEPAMLAFSAENERPLLAVGGGGGGSGRGGGWRRRKFVAKLSGIEE